MTSAKALWTSKSTFISMTLNSLPIKDKSPFHTRSSICQCHHTKERGNLFMPNMPPVSTFGRPFEHCFLIKRGSLSSLFFSRNVSLIPLSSAWNSHDNISFNYSFIVTTIRLPFNPSLLLKPPRTCKAEKWHTGLHRNSSDFHPSHTGRSRRPRAFIWKLREHAPPGEKLWGGGGWGRGRWWVERGAMWGDGADPTPFIPYLGCFPLHIDRRVDWGLRLAATFSQKAREIQYWEWMATSCCQCCNLGNRQSTILVPPLATGMVGKTNWIFSAYGQYCSHTYIKKGVRIAPKSFVTYIQLSSL